MAITYEEVMPTLIPNTTMQKMLSNGVHRTYIIQAVEGYVLHDKSGDWIENDPITGEEIVVKGYFRGTASCGANYDFVENPREFYAVPESEVPADQIFGGGSGNHETA